MRRFMKKGLALILLAAMIGVLLPENLGGIEFAWAEDEHTHVDENGNKFTAWESDDSLPTEAGNYYLTKDVNLRDHASDWTAPEGEIRICLNGHSVKEPTYLYKLYVTGNNKLFIYDCADEEECGSIYGRIEVEDTASVTVNGGWIYDKNNFGIKIPEDSSGTVTVNGGVIGDADAFCGIRCEWGSNGLLTINGGKIQGEYYGLLLWGGTAKMTGGIITDIVAEDSVVVSISEEAQFEMSGGTIHATSAETVAIDNDGIVSISAGTVESEDCNAISNCGTLEVSGGTIGDLNLTWPAIYNYEYNYEDDEGNIEIFTGTATIKGGTILSQSNGIKNAATLEVWDGTIKTVSYPAIYTPSGAKTVIKGGTISSSHSNGVSNDGMLEIEGGSIEGGKIEGGSTYFSLFNSASGSVTISGGTIVHSATDSVKNMGIMTVSGGTIESGSNAGLYNAGGTLTVTDGTMSGVTYGVYNQAVFELSGRPEIKGNTGDIYLTDGKFVTISGALTGAYRVGMQTVGVFTDTADENKELNKESCFTAAKPRHTGYAVKKNEDGQLELVYAPETYTVAYNPGQYGEGEIVSDSREEGAEPISLSSEKFERKCYTQTVWALEDDGEKAYDFGAKYAEDADITLYPYWEGPEHTFATDEAIEPTCTDTGLTEGFHCSVCGEVLVEQETVAALGHKPVTDVAIEPTCTNTGLTEGSHCSVCEEVFVEQESVAALGHDPDDTWHTDEKEHYHICQRNGCSEKVDAADHTSGDWIVDREATTAAEGSRHKECTVCGEVLETETIPKKEGGNAGRVDKDVESGENAPEASLPMDEDELADAVLDEDEKQAVENGTDIRIVLNVKDAGESVSPAIQQRVEAAIETASEAYTVGQYLDISLTKIISDGSGTMTQGVEMTNEPILITITIPENMKGDGNRTFAILRVHGKETDILEDQDPDPDAITIETDRFSTYVLIYQEEKTAEDNQNQNDKDKDDQQTDDKDKDDQQTDDKDKDNQQTDDKSKQDGSESGSRTDDKDKNDGNVQTDVNDDSNGTNQNGNAADSQNGNTSNNQNASAKTGDMSHVEIYATITMIAGLASLLLYFKRRERGMGEK